MESLRSISIIIPVKNEEKRVENCIQRILASCNEKHWDFDLIFVVDNTTDKTISILNRYIGTANLQIIQVPSRLGKGGSIKYAALNHTIKDYLAYMDVDLAAGPDELEKLLTYVDDNDVVIGSRLLHDDSVEISRPIYRTILSHLYSRTFRFLFRMSIRDPQCGLKLFRKVVIPKLLDKVIVKDFAFDTDLVVNAYAQKLRIKEVPINWIEGKYSSVSIIRDIKLMGLDLLSIWFRYHILWKEDRPTYPQKKGSIYGRILFGLLSLNGEIKNRNLEASQVSNQLHKLSTSSKIAR